MSRIIEAIHRHAEQRPDSTAITSLDSSISYRELRDQVAELAEVLVRAKYKCIGLVADNSIAWAMIDLACLQAGVCCIPVPAFFTPQQIAHVIHSAGVQALIGDSQQIAGCGVDVMANSYPGELAIAIHELREQPAQLTTNLAQISKVTFTSGSTGTPKGVCLGREQIENTVQALNQVVPAGTSHRHLSVLPLVTLLENIAGLYVSLVQGAQILLYPMSEIGFNNLASLDQQQFFKTLRSTQPQSVILVPELLRLLMHGVSQKWLDADSFKFIAVGGGTVSATLLQQAATIRLPVLQGYGLSECASVVSLNSLADNRLGSVGKPLQHIALKIAEDGEIFIAGNLMHGYLGEPPQTGDWLATGDLGYVDEQGYLHVTGRKKNLLITAFGKNISPEWVESVFLTHPLIKQILVTGEASTHLRAVIVPSAAMDSAQLKPVIDEINNKLPDYARVRDFLISSTPFLFENGLLTANGRLKRSAIAAQFS